MLISDLHQHALLPGVVAQELTAWQQGTLRPVVPMVLDQVCNRARPKRRCMAIMLVQGLNKSVAGRCDALSSQMVPSCIAFVPLYTGDQKLTGTHPLLPLLDELSRLLDVASVGFDQLKGPPIALHGSPQLKAQLLPQLHLHRLLHF